MISKHIRYTAIAIFALAAFAVEAQEKTELKDTRQKSSYAIGLDIGSNFKRQDIDIDAKALAAGIADALAGKPQLTDAEAKQVLSELRAQLMAKAESKEKEASDKNQKDGERFLSENKTKPGVKTTASGLQYKVLKSGSGKTPKPTDTVKVHYHGTLIDGSVFDSSVERGDPAMFGVTQVIPGWTEVLQLMKEGDKWQVYIPSQLAYGPRSPSPKIGPNSTLIFDVELLSIEKPN